MIFSSATQREHPMLPPWLFHHAHWAIYAFKKNLQNGFVVKYPPTWKFTMHNVMRISSCCQRMCSTATKRSERHNHTKSENWLSWRHAARSWLKTQASHISRKTISSTIMILYFSSDESRVRIEREVTFCRFKRDRSFVQSASRFSWRHKENHWAWSLLWIRV